MSREVDEIAWRDSSCQTGRLHHQASACAQNCTITICSACLPRRLGSSWFRTRRKKYVRQLSRHFYEWYRSTWIHTWAISRFGNARTLFFLFPLVRTDSGNNVRSRRIFYDEYVCKDFCTLMRKAGSTMSFIIRVGCRASDDPMREFLF